MLNAFQRSEEIWKLISQDLMNIPWSGFTEIQKLEEMLQRNEIQYKTIVEDGGITIVCKSKNGKHVGTIRENCFSDGSALDLVEVFGLYKDRRFFGFQSAAEALMLIMNSLTAYQLSKPHLTAC